MKHTKKITILHSNDLPETFWQSRWTKNWWAAFPCFVQLHER